MLKNPQDSRARRTARQIKETMFFFLESRAIHEISVSEICKTCQINRATFYDHYRDVFDLVQDMELDLLLALQALMEQVTPEDTEAEQVSRLFFDFLAEHRKKMRLLLNNERSRAFCLRLDSLIMPFLKRRCARAMRCHRKKSRRCGGSWSLWQRDTTGSSCWLWRIRKSISGSKRPCVPNSAMPAWEKPLEKSKEKSQRLR